MSSYLCIADVPVSRLRSVVLAVAAGIVGICTLLSPVRQSWAADPPSDEAAPAADCAAHLAARSAYIFRFREWMTQAEAGAAELVRSHDLVVATWRREIEALRSAPAQQQMERVNSLVNHLVRYRPDVGGETWGKPLETLITGGDCEDYALLKAYSLLRLDWPRQALYLAIGRLIDGRRHAMLSVELDGETYLLDSLSSAPFEARRYPWQPLYRLALTEPDT